MKKFINFVALALALAMDKLECEEGGTCQLTDEQLGRIDSKLNELTSQHDDDLKAIAERDSTIAELREQVANLQEAPGDEDKKIEDDGEETPVNSLELFNSIKDIV